MCDVWSAVEVLPAQVLLLAVCAIFRLRWGSCLLGVTLVSSATGGRDRGVHAARQTADGATVADLLSDLVDERVGDVRRGPRRRDAGDLVQEP